jgi:Holliday junction DNA helicase RuvA
LIGILKQDMIATLSGEITGKKTDQVVLECGGVGYGLYVTFEDFGALEQAIASGDTKFISQATGVGKRVAERVVVDLKDKVGLVASDDATGFLAIPSGNSNDEALQALVTLGYSVQDAAEALKGIDEELSTEDRIKQALKAR